jgi:hypothetical protein
MSVAPNPVWLCVLVGPRYRPYVFDVPLDSFKAADQLWKSLATGYGFKEMASYRTATAGRALSAYRADLTYEAKEKDFGPVSKSLKRLKRRK